METQEKSAAEKLHPPSLEGLRVLVVEDDGIIQLLLDDQLQELGCKVVGEALRLEYAIDLIHSRDFDVAVLDIFLGSELCYPAAEELDLLGKPFFFLTGYPDTAIHPNYKDRICVTKPFRLDDLKKALCGALATNASRR